MKCPHCKQECTNKHFDDLTKIDVPFKMLDKDTQQRLTALPEQATQQRLDHKNWITPIAYKADWKHNIYRQNPDWVPWPEKPSDSWLAKHKVRLAEDKPRVPTDKDVWCTMHSGSHPVGIRRQNQSPYIVNIQKFNGLRWIVEPISGWVECDVICNVINQWMVYCKEIPQVPGEYKELANIAGYKGFGGIRYENDPHWFSSITYFLKQGGQGTKDPVKVRFWVD